MTRNLRVAALCVAAALWACLPARGTTILPGISGTVFRDLDASGKPSPGEGISGAVLRLFLDNGDGVFQPDAGDAPVGADVLSAADGTYAFGDLAPMSKYFVQQPAQLLLGVPQPPAISSLLVPAMPIQLIDAFNNSQKVVADPMTPVVTSTLNDPMGLLVGLERDLYVRLLTGVGEVQLRSKAYGVEVLQYDNSAGVIGRGVVTWDGPDISAGLTPSLGLGNLDLTDGGATGILFKLGVDSSGAGDKLGIRLFADSGTEYSEGRLVLPVTDGAATAYAYLPFDDFVGPVSPNRVNAIQMWLGDGRKSVDTQIDSLGAWAPVEQNFSIVPEPAAATLALAGLAGLILVLRRR